MKVKICGIHIKEDVKMVASLQPDYMGFVLNCDKSPRSNSIVEVKDLVGDLEIPFVFLFVNETEKSIIQICTEVSPFAIQLHGDENSTTIISLKQKLPSIQIWKAIHIPVEDSKKSFNDYLTMIQQYEKAGCDLFVLDSSTKNSYGGTGVTCDWNMAAKIVQAIKTPILLAGGLTPSNVSSAINIVKPFGVDVSSGVEKTKAKKDPILVKNFINAAR